jgi:hypothetical protein
MGLKQGPFSLVGITEELDLLRMKLLCFMGNSSSFKNYFYVSMWYKQMKEDTYIPNIDFT